MPTRKTNYDLIRVVGTILIFLYHYYQTLSCYMELPNFIIVAYWGNYDVCAIAVVIFFMLSGSVLINKYENIDTFSAISFYKNRFIKIFPIYWFLYAVTFLIHVMLTGKFLFYGGTFSSIIVSILQLDYFAEEVIARCGASYLLIGEWINTVIIICYLLFPLLRTLYKKYIIPTTIIIFLIFLFNLYFKILSYGGGFFSITTGLFAFWLGMLIIKIDSQNIPCLFIGILAIVFLLFFNFETLFNNNYLPHFFFGVSLFIALFGINYCTRFCKPILDNSYEIYLVHHRIQCLLIPYFISSMSIFSQHLFYFIFITFITVICAKYSHQLNIKISTRLSTKVSS